MLDIVKFYRNKKILITGNTGFKGSWLQFILDYFGANVYCYSLRPLTNPSNYNILNLNKKKNQIYCDVKNYNDLKNFLEKTQPEIIFHLAAQSLVKKSYKDPKETFNTNCIGTLNILDISMKLKKLKSLVIVTSDKCYKNKEKKSGYNENDELGGSDPYSSSKAAAENIFSAYLNLAKKKKLNFGLVSVRAGNVIGGGDWSEDRIIPDFIKSLSSKKPFYVRSPNSVRPWQHVLDLLNGYLILAMKLYKNPLKFSGSWNFGPNNTKDLNVLEIIKYLKIKMNVNKKIILKKDKKFTETVFLKLKSYKSKNMLNWKTKLNTHQALELTAEWFDTYLKKSNVLNISKNQVKKFYD